jgi:hypothetical protein
MLEWQQHFKLHQNWDSTKRANVARIRYKED